MNLDPRSFDLAAFGVPATDPDEAAQTLAEDCTRALWQRDAAARTLGLRVDEVGPGRAVLTMTVRADMLNALGSCHGGLLFTLADSAFGYACNTYDRATVAAGCSIDYLAPVPAGERLRAEAVERSRRGRTGTYDVTVTNASGEVVALLRGRSHEVAGSVTQRD